jgi:hypothetical protein
VDPGAAVRFSSGRAANLLVPVKNEGESAHITIADKGRRNRLSGIYPMFRAIDPSAQSGCAGG